MYLFDGKNFVMKPLSLRKYILQFLIVLFITPNAVGQGSLEWAEVFSGPDNSGIGSGRRVKVDSAGYVYVLGSVSSMGGWCTVKYNSDGYLQWSRSHSDFGSDIAVDSAGNVYVVGSGMIKYDTYGNKIFEIKTIETYSHVNIRKDGNIVISGSNTSRIYSPDGVFISFGGGGGGGGTPGALIAFYGLIRYEADVSNIGGIEYLTTRRYNFIGGLHWTRTYRAGLGQIFGLAVDKSGNAIVLGQIITPGGVTDDWVIIKYDADGNQHWDYRVDYLFSYDFPRVLALDKWDNIYAAGTVFNNRNSDWYVISLSPNGSVRKSLIYSGTGEPSYKLTDEPYDMVVDHLGNAYITGVVRRYGPRMATIKMGKWKPFEFKAYKDTTVYLGYGSNCVTLSAIALGGIHPYFITWGPGLEQSQIVVCPEKTTVYHAWGYDDASPKSASGHDSVTVTVIDVRCGKNLEKILVCHKGKTICIDKESLSDHFAHGDQLGTCESETVSSTSMKKKESFDITDNVVSVSNYPNPFTEQTLIKYHLPFSGRVLLTVSDRMGRQIGTIVDANQNPGSYTVNFSSANLPAGIYFYKLSLQGLRRMVYQGKMLKIN